MTTEAHVVSPARFPALAKLVPGRKKVPFVQQMEAADCGAACLAMVLALHGRSTPLAEARVAAGTSASGTSAANLLAAATKHFHLRGRALRAELPDLAHLPAGTILHWQFNHFVVLDHVDKRGVHIVDPALGRRTLSLDTVGRAFTGVALVLELGEGFEKKKPGAGLIAPYLKRMISSSGGVSRIVVVSIMLQLFALATPILTGLVVDRVVPRGDTRLLTVVIGGLIAIVGFQTLSQLVRAHLLLQMRTNLDTRMVLGFLDHLVSLPYAFFQRRSTGDLLQRVSSNQTIREILSSQALSALIDGSLVVVYLLLIVSADPIMAAVVCSAAALQLVLMLIARPIILEQEARGIEARTRSQSQLVQLLSGIATLKLAGAERHAVTTWSNEFAETLNADLSMGRTSAMIDAVLGVVRTAAPMTLLAYGAHRVLSGDLTLGTMLAVNSLAGAFLGPVGSLVMSVLSLQRVRGHLERLEDVTSIAPEQSDNVASAPTRLRGDLALERVSFRYAETGAMVLKDISLSVRAGEHVAIVGASGSGKSTCAALLLGLYPPNEGRILVDGRDLAGLDLRGVRPQLGTVPQAPYFFDGSIRSNIALADPDASLDRIIAAARIACIHDDIAAMPMGYETLVADRGQSLSGGQRQRLALARALLTQPAALVLDEATSALDAETEARLTAQLRRLRMTRVSIAHRLSTVVDADLIVVMAGGQIVETGRHDELLARDGRYKALVAAQLGGRK